MTREDKQLLLKDLCARLPYGVKVYNEPYTFDLDDFEFSSTISKTIIDIIKEGWKPYLRPMSSMTEKEYETFPIPYSFDSFSTWNNTILSEVIEGTQILIGIDEITEIIDWFNKHHFDYRSLIEKGLALKAPEGMYEIKQESKISKTK